MIDIKLYQNNPGYIAAASIVYMLQKNGHKAYLIGGCVRDMLLGLVPHDWDVATSATPDIVQSIFPNTSEVGKSFGVVPINLGGVITQVATFRRDGVYSDNRHPDSVEFCTLEEDVQRRDFTINGMAYDTESGTLIDLVDGLRDLEDRVIRTIGNAYDRFSEDPLRILRAVRFATTLDFAIFVTTANTVKALSYEVGTMAWERISEELRKILLSPNRSRGIRLLDTHWILSVVLPEVYNLKGVEQPPEFHPEGDCWIHTLMVLSNLSPTATFAQAMAALLHDTGKPGTFTLTDRIRFNGHAELGAEIAREVCKRFRLTNDETEEICWIVQNHMKIKDIANMRRARRRRFMSEQHFQALLLVAHADAAASAGSMEHLEFVEREFEQYTAMPLRPVPLLRGQDLIDMGVEQGPIYGLVLQYVEDAQLDGSIITHEEAIALARAYLSA